MASIMCRKGETFPNSHRHDSVAAVRQCQGAPASWERNTNKPPVAGTERIVNGVRDTRNQYLNPKGVPAQLAAFDGSKLGVTTAEVLAGIEQGGKELAKFGHTVKSRVDPALEAKVPDGRYAMTGDDGATKFYRVRKVTQGQYAGRTFVDRQAGDESFPVRFAEERAKILTAIAANVKAAAIRYGRELGQCSQCGRMLTNPESIELGIGPVCLSRLG